MKFIELTIHTTTEGSELIADILWDYTNYGVAISDVNDVIALQNDKRTFWDYMDDDLCEQAGGDVLVKCFLPLDVADEKIREIVSDLDALRERSAGIFRLGSLETGRREVDGDDWIDIWKKHFRPIHIGERVVVCPEWIKYEKKPDEIVIRLDSNMAFGTGEHETTSMCLELLQKDLKEGDTVIDVGCGSGILGIAAAVTGAKSVYMCDIDAQAVDAARANAALNGAECRIEKADLIEGDEKADLVFANLTADILKRLAPSVGKHLNEGGEIVASGIISERLDEVKDAFAAEGFTVAEERADGDWCALRLVK